METNSTKVVTGKVRFCYTNVFEPAAMSDEDTPKYSVCILIPKSDTKTIKAIEKAVKTAMEIGKSKLANKAGQLPPAASLKLPLRDGDIDRSDDEAFAGMMFLNASTQRKPAVVDKDLNPIMDKNEFYSGCYGRASLNFYAFNVQSKGVAAGLNNLQKLEDGDMLAGGSSAEEDFGGENSWDDDDIM